MTVSDFIQLIKDGGSLPSTTLDLRSVALNDVDINQLATTIAAVQSLPQGLSLHLNRDQLSPQAYEALAAACGRRQIPLQLSIADQSATAPVKAADQRADKYRMALNSLHEELGFKNYQEIGRAILTYLIKETFAAEKHILASAASDSEAEIAVNIEALALILTKAALAQPKNEDLYLDESWHVSYPFHFRKCVGLRQFEMTYGNKYFPYIDSQAIFKMQQMEEGTSGSANNDVTDDKIEFAFRLLRGAISMFSPRWRKTAAVTERYMRLVSILEEQVAKTGSVQFKSKAFNKFMTMAAKTPAASGDQRSVNNLTITGKLVLDMKVIEQAIIGSAPEASAAGKVDAEATTASAASEGTANKRVSTAHADDARLPLKVQRTDAAADQDQTRTNTTNQPAQQAGAHSFFVALPSREESEQALQDLIRSFGTSGF